MRVFLATPSLLPEIGGPAYCVSAIHYYLVKQSCQVNTITRKAQCGMYVNLSEVERELKGYDIVHNFGTWTPFNHRVSTSAYRAGIPQVFCPMGMLEPWALGQKRLKKKIGWFLYQKKDIERSAAVHATSRFEADNLKALGIKSPIAIIPHGIDIPDEVPNYAGVSKKEREKTALFLSRLHPKKGLLELVEAWGVIRPDNWQLIIAGPDLDGYGTVVAEAVKQHSLQSTIRIVGPVFGKDKENLFSSSDLLILPTHSENFGLVVPEALGYGMPVITTTGAPWGELLETNSGWWIEPGVQPLISAMTEATNLSSHELQEMGLRGRKLVEVKYAWPSIIEKHIKLYRWICFGDEKPDFICQ